MSIYNNTRGRNFNTETGPIAVDFNDFASGHVYQRFEGAQTNRISNKYYAYFDVQSAGATTVAGDFTNDFVRQTTTFEHQRYFGFNRQKSFSDFLVQDEVVGSDANQTLIGADVFSVFDYNNVNPERWHSSERYAQTHKYGWNGSTHSFGDKLFGMGGDDTLKGMAGNDMLSGGTGNDVLEGGTGADSLFGGEGDDQLDGGSENDELYGGAGNDVLQGGAGVDKLNGGSGDDVLFSGQINNQIGHDELTGGAGRDVFIISSSATGRASPTYTITDPVDESRSDGIGWLIGEFTSKVLGNVPLIGKPIKMAYAGAEFLNGILGAGAGGGQASKLVATEAKDGSQVHIKDFNPFEDTIVVPIEVAVSDITGANFPTKIDGQWSTVDTAFKIKSGQTGSEQILAEVYWDLPSFMPPEYTKLVDGFPHGTESMRKTLIETVINRALYISKVEKTVGGVTTTVVEVRDGNGRMKTVDELKAAGFDLSAFDTMDLNTNYLVFGGLTGAFEYGANGSQTMYGTGQADVLYGTVNDQLDSLIDNGADTFYGFGGDDLFIGGAGINKLYGGEGSDTVNYSDAAGGVRVDLSVAAPSKATTDGYEGGYGEATATFQKLQNGVLKDYLADDDLYSIENAIGGAGADEFIGDTHANIFIGGAGADTLDGRGGDDILDGGAGADTFVVSRGADRILDFKPGQDRLQFGVHFAGLTWADVFQVKTDKGVKLEFAGNSVLLEGVQSISAADADLSGAPSAPVVNLIDLPGVTATQTSLYGPSWTADKAIDNDVETFNHTHVGANQNLMINLGGDAKIDTIEIVNRLDSYFGEGGRLNGATVEVLNDGVSVWSSTVTGADGASVHQLATGGVFGDSIKISHSTQWIHVGEVNAYGSPPVDLIEAMNVAAFQSTTGGPSYTLDKAFDGDANTFSHTENGVIEWVRVGLGGDAFIETIDILNRADGPAFVGERLNGASLTLMNDGFLVWQTRISGATNGSLESFDVGGLVADTLWIQHQSQYLQIAELDIYGAPVA